MGTFIYFTEEQKHQANEVDLAEFLQRQGEKLLPSGRDYRLDSDHSVTIRGSEWFDHETQTGGHAIDFVRAHYGMTFPEAVTMLLGGRQGQCYPQAREKTPPSSKPFALPPPNRDMRRVYAYLMKHRHIDRDVITHFARAGVSLIMSAHGFPGQRSACEATVLFGAHLRLTDTSYNVLLQVFFHQSKQKFI